ncbi:probable insulin-like peptide 3 [Drosophila elegans]|uniref:probable insulin-like peptide 3 n=1 Tax=Drosophila elegans TaxID=30023 RepID=UPI0007E83344|nr:probable insulin-like peptide 3 [Drosophila elegans]
MQRNPNPNTNPERRILLHSLILLLLMSGSVQASMKFCGSKLTEALSQLCVHGFNAMIKRTSVVDPMDLNLIEGFEDSVLLARMFGESAGQMLKTRRVRDGVFDECCLKSCRVEELLRYCAPKPNT